MLDPISLFTWEPHVDQRRLHADTLVVTLGSYLDAGHAQRMVDAHLLDQLPNRLLGRFDADQLIDYGGRRPEIVFDRDHFDSYAKPEIALHLVTDADGRDFLLLNGPEPSFQWERLAAGVTHVIEQLDVRSTVLVQAIPAPAPHTRPVAVTQYAGEPDRVAEEDLMLGTFALKASFPSVLTLRLGEAGHPVTGLLAHVPHYIADADYPAAASALMKALKAGTHLALPTGGFDLAASLVRAQIDQQVQASEELTEMVRTLEENYERFMSERSLRSTRSESLPSADEIGRQFEDFLAGLGDDTPDADSPAAGPTDPDAPRPNAAGPGTADPGTTGLDGPETDADPGSEDRGPADPQDG